MEYRFQNKSVKRSIQHKYIATTHVWCSCLSESLHIVRHSLYTEYVTFTYPVFWWTVVAPQMTWQPAPSSPLASKPSSWRRQRHASPFRDVVLPSLFLSASSSPSWHCALQDCLGKLCRSCYVPVPFQFASLYCGQEVYRAQWLRGRLSDSRLREPGFESWLRRENLGQVFSLYIAPVHSAELNEYLTIDSGGYVYEQPSRINCSIWLDASQRSRDGVWVNRSVREVKCKALWAVLRIGYCAI